jgi:hypothetical protein
MKHGEECRWHTAVDVRYTEDREETVIFVPYMPKGLL